MIAHDYAVSALSRERLTELREEARRARIVRGRTRPVQASASLVHMGLFLLPVLLPMGVESAADEEHA
jgi:hypothetical protein